MRWEELSMSDRSNLMKAYLQNGVVRLSDMRDHYNKFADGGEVDNVQSTPAQDFVASWLSNRQEQFQENFRNSGSTMVPYSVLPKSWSNKAAFKEYQKQLKNLRTVKQYDVLGNTKFPHVPESEFEAIKKLSNYTGGVYNPSSHSISYISPSASTDVHELTHSLNADPQINTIRYGFEGDKLQEGKQYNSYKDSAVEIYARLMQFRYLNKLDPKKKYTVEDIKKWREKYDDTDIINRYSDEYLLHLLNNVASTKSSLEKDGRKLAAYGGPLRNEYDNPESPEEYATFPYKPTLRRVNSFDRGGAVDLPVRDSTQPILRPILAGNFQEKEPKYTGPIVGEIRADERSKTQKFFDKIRTNYNSSSFGNSAVAEVLSATTPYGLIHEGMQGNTGSALMSIAPVGAVLKEGKVAANVARATYKAGKSIVSREQAQELAEHIFRSEKKKLTKELRHPNAEKKIKEFYKDHLQTDYTTPFNETNEIYVDPDILLDIDPIVTESTVDNIILSDFKARGTSYGEEVLKNLQKTPVVDNNLISRINKINNGDIAAAMYIGQDAGQLVYRAGDQLPSGKILTSSDAEFLNEFHKKYAGRIVSTYGTDPKIFADYILHEISHQSTNGLKLIDYLDGRPLANREFYPLLKLSLVDPKMANARYYENFTEKATRLKSVRRALEKRLKFSYLDTPIEQKHIDYLYNNYGKANIPEELTKSIERVTELYKRNPTKSTANYLNNKLEQYNNLISDFERSKLQVTPMEGLTIYKQDENFIDAINTLPPLKYGGYLK